MLGRTLKFDLGGEIEVGRGRPDPRIKSYGVCSAKAELVRFRQQRKYRRLRVRSQFNIHRRYRAYEDAFRIGTTTVSFDRQAAQ
jgi:hypothetical protein